MRGPLSSADSTQTPDFDRQQKRRPLPLSAPSGRAGCPAQLRLCARGLGRKRRADRCATERPRPGRPPAPARTSPRTRLLCSAPSAAFKGLLVAARVILSRSLPFCAVSRPALARIIPFLNPNTTAEMSSLLCNAGICQVDGNNESIHLARRQAKGLRKNPSRGKKKFFCQTLNSSGAAICLEAWLGGRRGLPCAGRVFSWGHGASSGFIF